MFQSAVVTNNPREARCFPDFTILECPSNGTDCVYNCLSTSTCQSNLIDGGDSGYLTVNCGVSYGLFS